MPRQNTSPADYPQAVLQQIALLAHHIVIARKRRGESQAQWAKKLGISQPTMARIERGDPAVAMASYVMCMWLINQASGLADLIAPQQDHAALEKEVAKVRGQRKPRAPKAATPKSSLPPGADLQEPLPKPPSLSYAAPAASSAMGDYSKVMEATQRLSALAPSGAVAGPAAGLAALMAKTAVPKP